ncbi:FtsX-like permease family protein [Stackebrandtia endophytica]|uniref:FtsX-like permease family protein n=1 Tax=Stackebrandtia endophytica TaxID=1496996 RepID=A0A543ATE8_9ACTN|nr:FtsX-like permease family protein [Stackebrandtia endophytica]TQL75870.1 FtsX-like permease family protein [Stackebrandtia endophytica]
MGKLAWMLLRGGGKRGLLGSALTFAAVAVTTALIMFAIAGNFAFDERGQRSSWRDPVEAVETATAIQATKVDAVADSSIVTVYLAATGDGAPPIPPGMSAFPKPGEVWVSEPLRQLIEELPADQLSDRYGTISGVLGEEAAIHSAELVAVIGVAPDSPALTGSPMNGYSATGISDFEGQGASQKYLQYQVYMLIATVLMVVPLLVFGGAAARLTVARRDQRLAALRLIGATPGQVVRLTVAEAMLTAAAGAVVGVAGYAAALPLVRYIEIDGATWYPSDLWPAWWAVAATVAAIPLLVGLSAVVGLRRVVISPLGVARRHTPPGLRAVRLGVLAALIVAFLVMSQRFIGMGAFGLALLVSMLGATLWAINLVGPWVVGLLGKIVAGLSRRGSTLLAGRRLSDDPRSVWRTISGIALTGFVAGFVGVLLPAEVGETPAEVTMSIELSSDEAEATSAYVAETLAPAEVSELEGDGVTTLMFTTANDPAELDRFRTGLAAVSPGGIAVTDVDVNRPTNQLMVDIGTGVLTVMVVSIVIAMVSTAVAGASSILDRRQTYSLMHLAGTPMKVLNAARRKETLIPLVIMGGGAIATGVTLALPFAAGQGVQGSVFGLLATAALGLVGVLAAGAATRPLLASVMRDTSPRPD